MIQTWGSIVLLIAVGSGALIPLQAGANAQLGHVLGHPLWATLVSLAISMAALIPVLLAVRPSLPNLPAAATAPWWAWIGGVIGVGYITAALILAPKLGAGLFISAVVAGQMIAAMLLDHFGLAGFLPRPTSLPRLFGAVMIVVGVLVMQIAQSTPSTANT
jgi:transporter family-2 protein